MKLKQKTTKELQEIIERDYGQKINEDEAQELGTSLLRLTKLALNHRLEADRDVNKRKS